MPLTIDILLEKFCINLSSYNFYFNFLISVITHDINIVSKETALIKCDIQNINPNAIKDFYWTKNHTAIDKISELKNRYKEYKENYTLEIPKSSK